MTSSIPGIHHVTMISGAPQNNLNFYTGLLGLRLVKLTVNFDDPGSYHFYYGDERGTPGTILTFFPHPGGYAGRVGSGQAAAVALEVPQDSLEYWMERFASEAVHFEAPAERFGEQYISLQDPDGLTLELFARGGVSSSAWAGAPVPAEHFIKGVHGVTLLHRESEPTGELLQEMGYEVADEDGGMVRYARSAELGSFVDIIADPSASQGRVAVGSVHHVAFRTEDDDSQAEWRARLASESYGISPVMERDYFRSIYFREPGGVLFEIATDGPGMTRDEDLESLGTQLKLPAWMEPDRERIAKKLPPLKLPGAAVAL